MLPEGVSFVLVSTEVVVVTDDEDYSKVDNYADTSSLVTFELQMKQHPWHIAAVSVVVVAAKYISEAASLDAHDSMPFPFQGIDFES